MFIKLTNAHPTCKGESIYLNTNGIISFRRGKKVQEPDAPEVTMIFIPPHGTWEVEEKPDYILNLISKKSKKI